MNRTDLFFHGNSSFTDVLAEMSGTLKFIATSLSEKKRPRIDSDEADAPRTGGEGGEGNSLETIVTLISAFQKICAEEEHVDAEDALALLVDVKSRCLKLMKQ